jgi:purine-nucleoside phosphorylase
MLTENEFEGPSLPDGVCNFKPEVGIVLGSGLGPFVDQLRIIETISFNDIAGLPVSKVAGHAGKFLFTEVGGRATVIAQGRVHLYEGHTARQVAANVRFIAALGISKLVLTNAAGSANPEFAPGAWMMISDHINLTGTTPLLGGPNFFDMSEVYSARLRACFAKAAASENIALPEGVYAGLMGPQYETPAEVRMLRHLGADAIGMSTVIEAIQARALGLEVAGFSCITNWAAGLGKEPLNHEEVLQMGKGAAMQFSKLASRAWAAL